MAGFWCVGAADVKTQAVTGFGRKWGQVGRKNPSDSKGGRKIGIFPYPPYVSRFVRCDTFSCVFLYLIFYLD